MTLDQAITGAIGVLTVIFAAIIIAIAIAHYRKKDTDGSDMEFEEPPKQHPEWGDGE